jgi:hypothetical protein
MSLNFSLSQGAFPFSSGPLYFFKTPPLSYPSPHPLFLGCPPFFVSPLYQQETLGVKCACGFLFDAEKFFAFSFFFLLNPLIGFSKNARVFLKKPLNSRKRALVKVLFKISAKMFYSSLPLKITSNNSKLAISLL